MRGYLLSEQNTTVKHFTLSATLKLKALLLVKSKILQAINLSRHLNIGCVQTI